jgi:hypothetical protein
MLVHFSRVLALLGSALIAGSMIAQRLVRKNPETGHRETASDDYGDMIGI